MAGSRADLTQTGSSLVQKVLGYPDLYPDEFKAWIPRWVMQNVNFSVSQRQLPLVESSKLVGVGTNAVFANSWVNFGGTNEPALYFKDPFNFVHLGGIVKSGSLAAAIFTLPAGYRPQYALVFEVPSNGAIGILTVNPDGTVVASSGSNVYYSLSGITFRQFA